VIDLDDAAAIGAADPSGMLAAIARTPDLLREGHRLGLATTGLPSGDGVRAIVVCAMGSSAVVGDLVRALFANRLGVPVEVVRSPEIPELVGPHTVVIASSYSGTTAETIDAFEEAVRRGARAFAITSGGELARRCEQLGLACIRIADDVLMPRSSIGATVGAALGALEAIELIPAVADDVVEAAEEVSNVIAACAADIRLSRNPAKTTARRLLDRVPIVWGASGIAAVAAARWKADLNENAKVPSFWSELPELDHNEVVGWSSGAGQGFAIVALRHEGEHPDVASRFEPSLAIARDAGADVREVSARGSSPLARFLTLVVLGDLTSTYLGILRGVDPTPIEAIARLKAARADA
jgi:glucose/mannose-6-phosphate isomerase